MEGSWIRSHRQPIWGGPPVCRLGKSQTTHHKNQLIKKCHAGPQASSYEHSNEPSGSIKGREFLD